MEAAQAAFKEVQSKWGKKYPRKLKSWEENLPTLLTFYNYPASIRPMVYTTNHMERTIKDFEND